MAGISILRRLLMKEAMKRDAPFQKEGIMSISKALTTNVDSKVNRIVEGAKKQGIDFDKYNEEQVKYILELNRPKLQPAIPADSPEGRGITEALLGKRGKVIKADFGKPFAKEIDDLADIKREMAKAEARTKRISGNLRADNMQRTEIGKPKLDEDEYDYYREILDDEENTIVMGDETREMLEAMVKEQEAEMAYMKRLYDKGALDPKPGERGRKKFLDRKAQKGDKMTPEEIEELKKLSEDPEDMATGGRAGFSMGRRAFLKLLGGAAAGIGALKTGALKMFGKEGAKKAATDIVTTPPVPGKPAWFDSLVNKVIREGEDVTAKMSIKEREIVHQLSLEGKMSKDALGLEDVRVTQDLDEGTIRVQYNSPNNMGEDTVELIFKKGETTEEGVKVADEFYAVEKEPRTVGGPEDADLEFDGENVVKNVDELQSDTSALKQAATGEKQTMKEFIQSKNKKDKVKRINEDQVEQAEYLEEKYGPYERYMSEDDNFASGGRVGLLSGGGVIRVMLKKLAERYGKKPSELLAITNYKSLPVEVRKFLTKEQFEAVKKDMRASRVEQFENLRDMIKSRQEFDRSAEALKKMGMDISDTMLPLMNKAVTPGGTTPDDLLMMEQVIKNLRMKDRKLNASGGLAGMLGE